MNPQELYIDVSSGRFLDGETAIPTARPSVFSDEQKTLKVSVLRVKNNVVETWSPSAKSKYKVRLGTADLKLADGVEPTTAPPQLFTAQATVVTKASSQIKGIGTVYTYSPVTATFVASLSPTQGVTANIALSIYNPTLVTAVITASVGGTITTKNIVRPIGNNGSVVGGVIIYPPNEIPVGKDNPTLFDPLTEAGSGLQRIPSPNPSANLLVLSMTAVLGSGSAASGSAFVENGVLTSVSLGSRGAGYSGQSAQVVVSGGRNPTAATFNVTISGGSVVSISIATAGSGYLSGSYDVVFDSGDATATATASLGKITSVLLTSGGTGYAVTPGALVATASSVTATVSASVLNGFVDTLTITCAGSGYTSTPTLVFTSPRRSVADIVPSNSIGKVNGKQRFVWVYGLSTTAPVPEASIRFSEPDQSLADNIPTSVPSATLRFVSEDSRNNIWEINLISGGYGYTSAPTVTHDPAICSTSKIKSRKYLWVDTRTAFPGLAGFPPEVTQENAFELVIDRTQQTTIKNGGCCPDYSTTTKAFEIRNSSKRVWSVGYQGVLGTANLPTNHPLRNVGSYVNSDQWLGELKYDEITNATSNIQKDWEYALAYDVGTNGELERLPVSAKQNDVFVVIDYNLLEERLKSYWDFSYPAGILGLGFKVGNGVDSPGPNGNLFTQAVFPRHDYYESLPKNPQTHNNGYAGNFRYFVEGFLKKNTAGKFAVGVIRIPPQRSDYKVHFVANSRLLSSFRNKSNVLATVNGGGAFEAESEYLDYGENLFQFSSGSGLDALVDTAETNKAKTFRYGLRTDVPFYVSIAGENISVSVPTPSLTSLSTTASVVTKIVGNSIGYFFDSAGYGYGIGDNATGGRSVITISIVSGVTGFLQNVKLLNAPVGYSSGEYQCEIAGPTSGTTASVVFRQIDGVYSAVLLSGGSGYVTAPIITAPAPNLVFGNVVEGRVTNSPVGYSLNQKYFCSVQPSPKDGGDALVSFSIDSNGASSVEIINQGFGYTSAPIVTAPSFELGNLGKIKSIVLSNTPVGYTNDQTFQLEIASPVSGNTAFARATVEAGKFSVDLLEGGYGYTTAPVITGSGPNADQGLIVGATITCAGLGYAPGQYEAIIDEPPAGGVRAVGLISIDPINTTINITNFGKGYVTAPNISVPTPFGSVVSGITITCKGNYYIPANANITLEDATGIGALLDRAKIIGGEIEGVDVLNRGYGYSSPKVSFTSPTAPIPPIIPPNQIIADLNITTASANAILGTQNSREILLEVYETDGTSEQVVVQGTVNLAKRVKE